MTVLALIALILSSFSPCCEVQNKISSPPDYATLRMPEEPLQVWLDFSYGAVDQVYDDEGNTEPLGLFTVRGPTGEIDSTIDRNAETAALTLQLGSQYEVLQLSEQSSLQLGAELRLARHAEEADSILLPRVPAIDRSSGFTLQNLALSAALDAPAYTLRLDYLFDLGPEPERRPPSDNFYNNSDRRDALRLGASGRYATEIGYRLLGGANYVLITEESGENELERPDVLRLHAGAGFQPTENSELGIVLFFRSERASLLYGSEDDAVLSDGLTGSVGPHRRGRLLSIVPYLTYHAADAPFQIRLKAGFAGEYFDYGYALWGENEIAPGVGVTLGIRYGIL